MSHNYVANLVRAEGLRWTSPAAVPRPPGCQPTPLEVTYEVVVVDGPPARALRERQTEAIRAIL